jgi:hypothetical protein
MQYKEYNGDLIGISYEGFVNINGAFLNCWHPQIIHL